VCSPQPLSVFCSLTQLRASWHVYLDTRAGRAHTHHAHRSLLYLTPLTISTVHYGKSGTFRLYGPRDKVLILINFRLWPAINLSYRWRSQLDLYICKLNRQRISWSAWLSCCCRSHNRHQRLCVTNGLAEHPGTKDSGSSINFAQEWATLTKRIAHEHR
jgi:hypothetical protein